jgi:DNA-binding winged helix-turn-helix (wHTH) protein
VARARCVVAEVEIAFASRDLGWSAKTLDSARATLEEHGDRVNADHARYLEIRRLLLIGRIDDAERALASSVPRALRPATRAIHELIAAGIAMRRLRTKDARVALTQAADAARAARIPALMAEVEQAAFALRAPSARLIAGGDERVLQLQDVETVLASRAFIVDARGQVVRAGADAVSLARRPVLFALVRALAEAWPADVARETLIARAFESRFTDESHRARLRVEIARLRAAIRKMADVTATKRGFALTPCAAPGVVVLARPVESEHAGLLALLSDGEAWSTSALALTLGASQRTVQRALDSLATDGKVQSFGRGRARRWITPPVPGFATALLLPDGLPTG